MRFGRISKAGALALAAMIALAGCSATPPEPTRTGQTTAAEGGSATVAETTAFSSFNANSSTGSSSTNARIDYATHTGFYRLDSSLHVVRNEDFGTFEKTSDDPLTVKYTLKDGVQWSDGAPVNANDLFLAWAALSGYYDDDTLDARQKVASGTSYFKAADSSSPLAQTGLPETGDDGRSLTLTYTKPTADWETAFGALIDVPAHIVAAKAGLKDDDALTALFQNVPRGNPLKPVRPNPELRKVADFWNTGFDTKSMPDPSLALSNGPYVVKSIAADRSLVLTRNADYDWGPPAHLDTITVRYMPAGAQLTALQTGEADVVTPPATGETFTALAAMKAAGVQVQQGQTLGVDQVAVNFKGSLAKADFRQAFLKTVPREDILDKLVRGMDPQAKALDSQMFLPAQSAYAEATRTNGSSAFQDADLDGARKLLGTATPTVRILYDKDDSNRRAAYELIAASAAEAGFKVVDGGKARSAWLAPLLAGQYDVAIFGLTRPEAGVQQILQVFRTAGAANTNHFSSPVADQLLAELATTTDKAKQDALKVQLDKLVWDSFYGLPLFQNVGVSATSRAVTGTSYSPAAVGVWWNVWDWRQGK